MPSSFVRKRAKLSKDDRFQTRKQLGPLKNLVIPPYLQKRYDAALLRFFQFSDNGEHDFSCPFELDMRVAHYVECLWEEASHATGAKIPFLGL